ncbi:serine/threonine-protein kinase fray2-like [Bombus huntii]|uniref:serine/threonine-protein kinase fray2-like n=1 Tax=Bombus huntii TaxID=85661 RepID=UPI0021AAEBC0|nr:serine/threonine-protein kinase fray2-like [Bombus huntii]
MQHSLIIGADFLDTVEISIKGGESFISRIKDENPDECPEVLKIDVETQASEIDLSHVKDMQHSQDSDEGRRFRFEATRKDNVQVDVKSGKSEQEFCYSDIEYKEKKDKSKHDCNREHRFSKELNIDNKDLKYSTKYTKHSVESRNSRREDNKDYKSVRDVSSSLSSKHKTKDPKRHKNRDRNEHRSDRSQERCRSRNENDRSQNDKHRSKSNEKYKHHICDKSRDKSYQSYKVRSEDHGKFRGESERYIHKRMQRGPVLKLHPKFLGPYRVIKVLRNDRYIVQREGEHEGPRTTSTAADHMEWWNADDSDVSASGDDEHI